MWRFVLLLCLVAGSRQLSITKFTVPSAVESGEDVSLQCDYDLTPDESEKGLFVKWWWTPYDSEDRIQLYQRIVGHDADAIQSHVEIVEDDHIIIQNVTPAYSGSYECEVSLIDEIRQHQKLTVFTKGSGPMLNITSVEDGPDEDADADVLVTCEATDVAPRPDIVVTVNGVVIESSNESVSELGEGLFDITATARLSDDDAEDAEISCELTYVDGDLTHPQYKVTETYDANQSEMSTTEEPDDPSTPDPTSMNLSNARDSSGRLAAYFFLVLYLTSCLLIL